MDSRRIEIASDLSLDCRIGGPEGAPTILFLHGFPDFSYGWRKQLAHFEAKGFRVIAPDLHGYAGSSKPKAKERYLLGQIASDISEMLDRLGVQKCHVVGHDWGAALTWQLLTEHGSRFHTGTALCVPHLKVFFEHVFRNRHGQALRSWYMGLFQFPWLPEQLFKIKDGAWLASLLVKSSRRGTFTEADEDAYRRAWANPGAPTAMLNWYRANVFRARDKEADAASRVDVPMLIIWGDKDVALNHHMAEDSLKHCRQGRVLHFEKGTHWVHMEYPDEVNAAIEGHVKKSGTGTA